MSLKLQRFLCSRLSDVIDLRNDNDGVPVEDEEEDGVGGVSSIAISNSPIRSFTPISEATDCLIDFRRPQRSKKLGRRRRWKWRRRKRRWNQSKWEWTFAVVTGRILTFLEFHSKYIFSFGVCLLTSCIELPLPVVKHFLCHSLLLFFLLFVFTNLKCCLRLCNKNTRRESKKRITLSFSNSPLEGPSRYRVCQESSEPHQYTCSTSSGACYAPLLPLAPFVHTTSRLWSVYVCVCVCEWVFTHQIYDIALQYVSDPVWVFQPLDVATVVSSDCCSNQRPQTEGQLTLQHCKTFCIWKSSLLYWTDFTFVNKYTYVHVKPRTWLFLLICLFHSSIFTLKICLKCCNTTSSHLGAEPLFLLGIFSFTSYILC